MNKIEIGFAKNERYLNSEMRKLEDYSIWENKFQKIWIEAFSILKRFTRQSLLLLFHSFVKLREKLLK